MLPFFTFLKITVSVFASGDKKCSRRNSMNHSASSILIRGPFLLSDFDSFSCQSSILYQCFRWLLIPTLWGLLGKFYAEKRKEKSRHGCRTGHSGSAAVWCITYSTETLAIARYNIIQLLEGLKKWGTSIEGKIRRNTFLSIRLRYQMIVFLFLYGV